MVTPSQHQEGRGETAESKGETSALAPLVVRQPPKLESLLMMLSDLEKISEVVREEGSQDLGTGAGSFAAGRGAQGGSVSFRDLAIKALPSTEVMRQRLTHHLQKEVRELERRAGKLARSAKKGSAYLLNELYAKIRRIQSLIAELIEATAEVVKRLYIRLFIDHQQLV